MPHGYPYATNTYANMPDNSTLTNIDRPMFSDTTGTDYPEGVYKINKINNTKRTRCKNVSVIAM